MQRLLINSSFVGQILLVYTVRFLLLAFECFGFLCLCLYIVYRVSTLLLYMLYSFDALAFEVYVS